MTKRKQGAIYDFWHPRVEGQIRHTMNVHPEWFSFSTPHTKEDCVNSLAKRIVDEIVAGTDLASVTEPLANTEGNVENGGVGQPSVRGDAAIGPVGDCQVALTGP